jgi:hypothetical protein
MVDLLNVQVVQPRSIGAGAATAVRESVAHACHPYIIFLWRSLYNTDCPGFPEDAIAANLYQAPGLSELNSEPTVFASSCLLVGDGEE